MNYFIFNEINSKDKGIILKKTPSIPKAKRRVEQIVINGRNGVLHKDEETYEPIIYQLEATVLNEDYIKEIKSWLNGEGIISFSNYPGVYWNCWIINQIDFTKVAYETHEFPIELELSPFSFDSIEEIKELSEATTIEIKNTELIKPYIQVFGTGDINLTINNKTQQLISVEDYLEIDSELEECFHGNISKNSQIYGEYLYLHEGNNSISWVGEVEKIILKYRRSHL